MVHFRLHANSSTWLFIFLRGFWHKTVVLPNLERPVCLRTSPSFSIRIHFSGLCSLAAPAPKVTPSDIQIGIFHFIIITKEKAKLPTLLHSWFVCGELAFRRVEINSGKLTESWLFLLSKFTGRVSAPAFRERLTFILLVYNEWDNRIEKLFLLSSKTEHLQLPGAWVPFEPNGTTQYVMASVRPWFKNVFVV